MSPDGGGADERPNKHAAIVRAGFAGEFLAANFHRLLAAKVARLVFGDSSGRYGSCSAAAAEAFRWMGFTRSKPPPRFRELLHKPVRMRSRTSAISRSMSAAEARPAFTKKIGVAVADARVADGETFQAEFIDHASGGGARRILEDAAGALLAQGLAGAPLFIADTNSLENFAVRLGGKSELHCQHHIIGRKRSVPVFEGNLIACEGFLFCAWPLGRPYFADVRTDLRAVRSGIHPQCAADGTGDADQALHAAEIVFGAEGDRSAQIGGRIDAGNMSPRSRCPGVGWANCSTTKGSSPSMTRRFEPPPRNLWGTLRASRRFSKSGMDSCRWMRKQIGGAADAEGGQLGQRDAGLQLDTAASAALPGFWRSQRASATPSLTRNSVPSSTISSLLARLTLPAPMVRIASPGRASRNRNSMAFCMDCEVVHVLVAGFANAVGQRFAGDARNRSFAGGVNVQQAPKRRLD